MTTQSTSEIAKTNGSKPPLPQPDAIEATLIGGDLGRLGLPERLLFYKELCARLKLNELARPFEYILLDGKLTLYARKDCTDQLRAIHQISIEILSREKLEDIYMVTAKATTAKGRSDESMGALSLAGLKGSPLCNALMKCETKAKRRVTLSICGLGFVMDETEIETVSGAQIVPEDYVPTNRDITLAALNKGSLIEEPERPPIVTTIEPLENPFLHVMTAGKFKGKYLYQVEGPFWKAESAFSHGRINEVDYVNMKAADESPHLRESAREEIETGLNENGLPNLF